MSLELRQQLKLTQKLVMTQQLRQAIQLLQMNRLELSNALQVEMEQNPMLEEVASSLEQESSKQESLSAVEEAVNTGEEIQVTAQVVGDSPAAVTEVNWEDYANNFDADFSFAHEAPPTDAPSRFDFLSATPGLTAFLAWQLSHLSLNELDLAIARCILGNLNSHGFLEADIIDICTETSCSEEEAEAMLRLMQSLDPPGIAARSLQESLLLQLERRGLEEDSLIWRIVANCMNELTTRNFAAIARQLGSTVRAAQQATAVLSELTPYPGNEYSNEQAQYISPDVYVVKIENQLVVQLNSEELPQVQLSTVYQEMLAQKLGTEAKEYLQDKKRNAQLLLNALEYRKSTICRVMESIVKYQEEFFEKGASALKPLVLNDVARDIGVHESTVSRATANKYVHTPQGLYELKYFFSTAAAASDTGEELTSESIKQRLNHLIRSEDPAKPYSDNKLAELLEQEGIKLARRTVAKYREQMKILPVKHRRHRKD